ncbi:hypothetical protein Tco_0087340 [Tanacetum coccineum]
MDSPSREVVLLLKLIFSAATGRMFSASFNTAMIRSWAVYDFKDATSSDIHHSISVKLHDIVVHLDYPVEDVLTGVDRD